MRDTIDDAPVATGQEATLDVDRLVEAIAAVAVNYHDQLHSQPSVWEDRPEWVAGWIAAAYRSALRARP